MHRTYNAQCSCANPHISIREHKLSAGSSEEEIAGGQRQAPRHNTRLGFPLGSVPILEKEIRNASGPGDLDGSYYLGNGFSPSKSCRCAGRAFINIAESRLVVGDSSFVTLKCRERGFRQEIWQPRLHDHLLRGDSVISATREYIRNNPANWPKDKENLS